MVTLTNFKVNNKYYIILNMYNEYNKVNEIKLRVIINELIPKMNPNTVDYITLSTLSSSKEFIKECGLNSVAIPLPYIKKTETLHDIFKNIFIDDIIFLINMYI
jgi:major membrane immunogen (membrane-anchored lipoprotein)|tara:strand:+ start:3048 stop:3359 length:312 start_codon:yes stop_codon:yes gene_type:complete